MGGAIWYAVDSYGATITSSTFLNNSAYNGGALIMYSNDILITDSWFTHNEAVNDGGAIAMSGKNLLEILLD